MFLRLNVRFMLVKRVCLVLWFKPFKIPFSASRSLYRNNERNKKTYLSWCRIPPTEIPRFWCPATTAPVRTEGFFCHCNIAPGTDPASGTVKEDFRNFGQRFSGADFCLRQSTASCIFVGQIPICPTKVLALRGRGVLPSQTPFPRYHGDRLKTG